jgi:hypothetical protein
MKDAHCKAILVDIAHSYDDMVGRHFPHREVKSPEMKLQAMR